MNQTHPLDQFVEQVSRNYTPQHGDTILHAHVINKTVTVSSTAKWHLRGEMKTYRIRQPAPTCKGCSAGELVIVGKEDQIQRVQIRYDLLAFEHSKAEEFVRMIAVNNHPSDLLAVILQKSVTDEIDKVKSDTKDPVEAYRLNHQEWQKLAQKELKEKLGLVARVTVVPPNWKGDAPAAIDVKLDPISVRLQNCDEKLFVTLQPLQVCPAGDNPILSASAHEDIDFPLSLIKQTTQQFFQNATPFKDEEKNGRNITLTDFLAQSDTVIKELKCKLQKALEALGWRFSLWRCELIARLPNNTTDFVQPLQHEVKCNVPDWESVTIRHTCQLRIVDYDKFYNRPNKTVPAEQWLKATLDQVSTNKLLKTDIRTLADQYLFLVRPSECGETGTVMEDIKKTIRDQAVSIGCEIIHHISKPILDLENLVQGFTIPIDDEFVTKDAMDAGFPIEVECRLRSVNPSKIVNLIRKGESIEGLVKAHLKAEMRAAIGETLKRTPTRSFCFEINLPPNAGRETLPGRLQEMLAERLTKYGMELTEDIAIRLPKGNRILNFQDQIVGASEIVTEKITPPHAAERSFPIRFHYIIDGLAAADNQQGEENYFNALLNGIRKYGTPEKMKNEIRLRLISPVVAEMKNFSPKILEARSNDLMLELKQLFSTHEQQIRDTFGLAVSVTVLDRDATDIEVELGMFRAERRTALLNDLARIDSSIRQLLEEGSKPEDIEVKAKTVARDSICRQLGFDLEAETSVKAMAIADTKQDSIIKRLTRSPHLALGTGSEAGTPNDGVKPEDKPPGVPEK